MTSRLDAIEQRCRSATEGPWDIHWPALLQHSLDDLPDLVAVARAVAADTVQYDCFEPIERESQAGGVTFDRCHECPGCTLHDALAPLLAEETT